MNENIDLDDSIGTETPWRFRGKCLYAPHHSLNSSEAKYDFSNTTSFFFVPLSLQIIIFNRVKIAALFDTSSICLTRFKNIIKISRNVVIEL